MLTTLLERLVGDLPSAVHRHALEVVARAYVTRESLLRSVLGDADTGMVFSWLRQLPYIEASPEGLHPHDAVRATFEADLRWRAPEGQGVGVAVSRLLVTSSMAWFSSSSGCCRRPCSPRWRRCRRLC
ncbi:hypothetical protein ABZT02_35110 [Streptomyces sp. NPDC005402]|uniref:hypothetical protein n=1 Tax=Streptomyces sp. NPDC005402 TaxID=3155338 RepID=UPI0033A15D91